MLRKFIFFSSIMLGWLITSQKVNAQGCNCWIQRDTSFHVAQFLNSEGPPYYRNDDASTAPIRIPFNFCFWGVPRDTIYINTNGNITFDQPFGTFTSTGFPNTLAQIIAPFWADVDIANGGAWGYLGIDAVFYKVTSNYVIIQWDTVGYVGPRYCSGGGDYGNDSLNNTFQLIISNGTDPIIPDHNNVQFCYKGMHWTTGADSPGPCANGGHGFFGDPATIGANKGDGVSYVQIGQFASPNSTYSGQFPSGPNYDGVYWLNNKSFNFDLCSGTIHPLTSGVSPCDTFGVCEGDSTIIPFYFFTPIHGDSVWVKLAPPVPTDVSIVSNTPGPTDSIVLKFVGSAANYGFHTVNIYGYDNQTPSDTSFTSFVVEVDSSPRFHVSVSLDTICQGDSSTLTASGVQHYYWSNGATSSSIKVSPPSTQTYTLGLSNGKCIRDTTLTVTVIPKLNAVITANPTIVCPKDSSLLIAHGVSHTFVWSTGQTRDSIWVKPTDDSTFTVITSNSCFTDTAKILIHGKKPVVINITASKDTICQNDSTVLTATGGTAYIWNSSLTGSSVQVKPQTTTTYSLVAAFGGACQTDTSISVTVIPVPVVQVNSGNVCSGQCVLLTASTGSNNPAYSWSNGATNDTTTVCPTNTSIYTVSVTADKCTTRENTTVTVKNTIPVNACCNDTIMDGNSTTLKADSSVSYLWTPTEGLSCDTCPIITASPTVTTTYTVIGTDKNGCRSEQEVTVIVGCDNFKVPNIFTPNHDGINDELIIQAQQMTSFKIVIYDRWGKEMYQSSSTTSSWNGTDEGGAQASDGTYYYVITASCGGASFNKKGFVQVLR
jgi:gliding motility-associated-like protein